MKTNTKTKLVILGTLLLNSIFPIITLAKTTTQDILAISLNPSNSSEASKEILNYEIQPSKQIEDILTVKNISPDQSFKIKLYAVDSNQTNSEAVGYKLNTAQQKHLGQWITLSKDQVILKPGESTKVPYNIIIPEKVTPGTYQGAIAAEMLIPDQLKTTNNNQQAKIEISSRIVEPIILSIPGRKIINYQLSELSQKSKYNQPEFGYTFENTGNVFLKNSVTLTINGSLLDKPTIIDLKEPLVLQGDTYQNSYVWTNAPLFGNYHAKLDFQVKEYNVATDKLVDLKIISKEIDFVIIPWYHIFAILILITSICGTIYWFKEQARVERANTFIHKTKKGDTVTSLSETYQISWKKIVKINKLKKPYILRSNRNLLLPFPTKNTNTTTLDKKKK